jgi:hypothetical protein
MGDQRNIVGGFNWIKSSALALAAAAIAWGAPAHSASAATNYYTTDYFDLTTYHDTDVTKTVTDYSVTINAFINGSQSVYSETFSEPFTNSAVQAGVAAALGDLNNADATDITGPTLESNSTTLQSSTTKTVVTGEQKIVNPKMGDQPVTVNVGPTTAHFFTSDGGSPLTIVGHQFLLLAGKQDIDIMAPLETVVDRTVTTTDTFLTDEVYDLFGTVTSDPDNTPGNTDPGGNDPPPSNTPDGPVNPVVPPTATAIPLPAAFWPAMGMLGLLGLMQLANQRRVRLASRTAL